ncbi:beta-carotene hydroxylase [Caulobacter sp. HMWF009]|nr:beta-carotene hydroxylase [Caulobacter sp. HMWF009]PTT07004.1 beta-carotene hydroxylase [Caulobacter sp. HMWF025]
MGGVPWGSVAWALANTTVWFALWPLTLSGWLPLWAAFPIATVSIALSYLPSHEAQHRIIARPGEPLFWLNELIGHISTLSLVLPYDVARLTHYEHHKHANHPELDPDISTHAAGTLDFLRRSLANRQPSGAADRAYGETLQRLGTPEAGRAMLVAAVYRLSYFGILFGLAWSGHALEAALVWWLPRHLAATYIQYYLSWAPHHPAQEIGRYRDTRAFRSPLGNILTMGMQFHIIHHLYPRIPLMRTPAAYWALRPVLKARGCELGGL